jgi:hypothetical protein
MLLEGIVLRVVKVTRAGGGAASATFTTNSVDYEGTLQEPKDPECGKHHPLKDGDSVVVLRPGERPNGDLPFRNVSCECVCLLYDVSSRPTERQ